MTTPLNCGVSLDMAGSAPLQALLCQVYQEAMNCPSPAARYLRACGNVDPKGLGSFFTLAQLILFLPGILELLPKKTTNAVYA